MHLSSAPKVTAPTEVIFQPKILHNIAIFSTAMQFSYLNMVLACTKVVWTFLIAFHLELLTLISVNYMYISHLYQN